MEADKNPLEAVRAMMIDSIEKSRSATQSYLDLVERTMRSQLISPSSRNAGTRLKFRFFLGDGALLLAVLRE